MSDLIVSTLTQGLIYALLSYGVYITYSVLDFPDLTVDSSFPLGAAVTAILLLGGVDPWLTLLCAAGAGALAGLCTGLIHVRLGVRDLLAGIITMTALSSVNLLIAGSNVTVERAVDTIFTSAPVMALLGGGFWLGYRHHWNFSHPIFHPVQGLPEPAEGQGPAVPGHPPGDHSGAAGEHSI